MAANEIPSFLLGIIIEPVQSFGTRIGEVSLATANSGLFKFKRSLSLGATERQTS